MTQQQREFDWTRAQQQAMLRDAVLPDTFCEGKKVRGAVLKAMLLAIDGFAGGRGRCFASIQRLADAANFSLRHAKRALKILAAPGVSLVHCERRLNSHGVVTNHYGIVWTELALRVPEHAPSFSFVRRGTDHESGERGDLNAKAREEARTVQTHGAPGAIGPAPGAVHSVLGAERSALGADQSALGADQSALGADQSAPRGTQSPKKLLEETTTYPERSGSAWSDDWVAAVLDALRACRVNCRQRAIEDAQRNRVPPTAVLNAIEHWRSHPGAWCLGTLRNVIGRMTATDRGDEDGLWGPTQRAYREANERHKVVAAARRQSTEIADDLTARETAQEQRYELERRYGATLDSQAPDEREQLIAAVLRQWPQLDNRMSLASMRRQQVRGLERGDLLECLAQLDAAFESKRSWPGA